MIVHTIGLQRAGTNYVGQLVKLNLTESVIPTGDRSVCWKHALPHEKTPAGITAMESVNERRDVLVCLVTKHALHWIASVTMREAQDLYLKRKALLGDDGPDLAALVTFYCNFYRRWLAVLAERGGFVLVHYEKAMQSPSTALHAVAAPLGLPVPEVVIQPDKIPYSRPMPQDAKERYLSGRHGLDDATAERVRSLWDGELMAEMGYAAEPPC